MPDKKHHSTIPASPEQLLRHLYQCCQSSFSEHMVMDYRGTSFESCKEVPALNGGFRPQLRGKITREGNVRLTVVLFQGDTQVRVSLLAVMEIITMLPWPFRWEKAEAPEQGVSQLVISGCFDPLEEAWLLPSRLAQAMAQIQDLGKALQAQIPVMPNIRALEEKYKLMPFLRLMYPVVSEREKQCFPEALLDWSYRSIPLLHSQTLLILTGPSPMWLEYACAALAQQLLGYERTVGILYKSVLASSLPETVVAAPDILAIHAYQLEGLLSSEVQSWPKVLRSTASTGKTALLLVDQELAPVFDALPLAAFGVLRLDVPPSGFELAQYISWRLYQTSLAKGGMAPRELDELTRHIRMAVQSFEEEPFFPALLPALIHKALFLRTHSPDVLIKGLRQTLFRQLYGLPDSIH